MELYNELTDLTLVKQTPDEEVAIPTSAEIEPDNEKPASIPAALLEESPDDTPPAAPMVAEAPSSAPVRRKITPAEPILTIDSRSTVENEDAREASAWHEIHNAYRIMIHRHGQVLDKADTKFIVRLRLILLIHLCCLPNALTFGGTTHRAENGIELYLPRTYTQMIIKKPATSQMWRADTVKVT